MAQVNAGAGDTANRLFSGFDSIANGMLASSAVEGDTIEKGLPLSLTIQVCQSVSELANALEIDSSVSVSFLKAFNATAKMKFMSSLNVTENNLTIVVYARNGIGRFEVTEVALKPGIKPPADDAEAAKFVRAYGDSYVSAASQGGEYYAVYTFRTTTRTEQSSLTASLRARGISGGLTVDAEAQVKLTNFVKDTQVSWTLRQEMTGIKGISMPGPDEMIGFARNFSKLTMNSPVTTDFAVKHYENVPNFGDAFRKVTANRRHFLGERGILASLARLRGLADQIRRLKDIYQVYGFKDPELDALSPKVETDLKTIEKQVHDWEDDPTGEFARPELPSLARGEPVLTFEVGQPASFGSETGPNFDFMRVGAALRDHVRIASIQLADGKWGRNDEYHVIRRLKVGYTSEKRQWEVTHGQGGEPRGTLFLEDGHFPSRLRIGHGGLVDSIEVQSGQETIKAGGPNGTIVDWKPEKGAVVLGFAGRAGGALDQIRIIHATLKPATYVQPH